MPLQFTATNGPLRCALFMWMLRATTSFPTPVSPRMSTFALVRAAAAISWRRACSTGLLPISVGSRRSSRIGPRGC